LHDAGHDIPVSPEQCTFCIHYFGASQACEAFPNGIPEIIRRGKVDHLKLMLVVAASFLAN